uniref:Uncharacterized protein n=1 Tax=Glossina pallidipes TaxID=7398 RepID=A0A1B0AJU7_GLOPL
MIRRTDLFSDELYNSGPSTSAHARLIEQLEKVNAEKDELQRHLAVYEGQAVGPQPDSVVPDVEELREVVKCLTPEGKIVHLCFDEGFTNNQAVYSRRTDTLIGCGYTDERKKKTRTRKTMLVFAVRSLRSDYECVGLF